MHMVWWFLNPMHFYFTECTYKMLIYEHAVKMLVLHRTWKRLQAYWMYKRMRLPLLLIAGRCYRLISLNGKPKICTLFPCIHTHTHTLTSQYASWCHHSFHPTHETWSWIFVMLCKLKYQFHQAKTTQPLIRYMLDNIHTSFSYNYQPAPHKSILLPSIRTTPLNCNETHTADKSNYIPLIIYI